MKTDKPDVSALSSSVVDDQKLHGVRAPSYLLMTEMRLSSEELSQMKGIWMDFVKRGEIPKVFQFRPKYSSQLIRIEVHSMDFQSANAVESQPVENPVESAKNKGENLG